MKEVNIREILENNEELRECLEIIGEYLYDYGLEGVPTVRFVETFKFNDLVVHGFSVETDEEFYWLFIGDLPLNMYPKKVDADCSKFKHIDEAFSMHLGIMLRLFEDQQVAEENK